MAKNHSDRDVYIVNVGGEYRVRPAVAAVKGKKNGVPGQLGTVSFRNTTQETVVLVFPSNTLTAALGDVRTLLAGKGEEFKLADLDEKDPEGNFLAKVVTYVAAVIKGNEVILATGESDLRLIIDP